MSETAVATLHDLTPRDIVRELDHYVIGQANAKRMVAIALRNRWRRQRVADDLRDDIMPHNILLIGPTGVGKTEIARRLAKLAGAPFIKVEASKFTEVGYVGRDVESIVRDLLDVGIELVRAERRESTDARAKRHAEERMLDLLLPPPPRRAPAAEDASEDSYSRSRERVRDELRRGALDHRPVEFELTEKPTMPFIATPGMDLTQGGLGDSLSRLFPPRTVRKTMTVGEARGVIESEETEKLVDMDSVTQEAVRRTQELGIVFLDEFDKICGDEARHGPDISREGVQRDLLPIVEGSTVTTKHGMVRTDHILFIAAGAFHHSKPSDLIPELQGRFPIRVELDSLTRDDFVRILQEPRNALLTQYQALFATEGYALHFTPDAVEAIADVAAAVNDRQENIGARRLHTVMNALLEDVLFDVPDRAAHDIHVDAALVRGRLDSLAGDEDLSRFIL